MSLNKDQVQKAHELYSEYVQAKSTFHPFAGRISELSETGFGPEGDLASEHLTFSGLCGHGTPFDIPSYSPNELMANPLEASYNTRRLPQEVGEDLFMGARYGMSDNVYRFESSCTTKQVAFGGIVNMEQSGPMAKPRWVHDGLRFRLTAKGNKLTVEYSSGVQMNFILEKGTGTNFEGSGIVPSVAVGTDIHLVTSASVCGIPNFQGFYGVQNYFMNNTIKCVKEVRMGDDKMISEIAVFRPTPTVDQAPLCEVVGMAFDDEVGTKVWISERLPVVCSWDDARKLVSGSSSKAPSSLSASSSNQKYMVYRWGEVKDYNGCDKGMPYFRAFNQLLRKGIIERMNELDDSEFVDV